MKKKTQKNVEKLVQNSKYLRLVEFFFLEMFILYRGLEISSR